MSKVREVKMEMRSLREMMNAIICKTKSEIDGNIDNVDTKELGEAIDMIKDLAEAKEKRIKALYYELICDAMEESEENEGRHGYGHNKHPSKQGHGSGFIPENLMEYWDDDEMMVMDDHTSHHGHTTIPEYGRPYSKYMNSRRVYTESHSAADKSDMDRYATDHLSQSISTMKDIWKDADPNLRMKMKNELTKLVSEMNA